MKTDQTCSTPCPLSKSENEEILRWWQSLKACPSDCEEIRRVTIPEQLLDHPRIVALRKSLPDRSSPTLSLPLLGGLLANVDQQDSEMRFICRLGVLNAESGKPSLSEVHFVRLSTSTEINTLYRRLRRAILLLRRSVDIPSLADCAIGWAETHLERADTSLLAEQLSNIWAKEYRQYLSGLPS